MDTLKNKAYHNYDYTSRYTSVPYYYDEKHNRWVYGIGTGLKKNSDFVAHTVTEQDTLHSLALKYYNNPTFWWVIGYFNNILDAFIKLSENYTTIRIPNIATINFGEIR